MADGIKPSLHERERSLQSCPPGKPHGILNIIPPTDEPAGLTGDRKSPIIRAVSLGERTFGRSGMNAGVVT